MSLRHATDALTITGQDPVDHRKSISRYPFISAESWPVIVKASVTCRKLIGSDHVTKILEKLK